MLAAPLDFGDGENDVDGDTASEVSAQPTAKKVLVAVLFILIMTLVSYYSRRTIIIMYRNTCQRPVFSVGMLGTFSNDLHSIIDLRNKWVMFVTFALLITFLFEFCPWQLGCKGLIAN